MLGGIAGDIVGAPFEFIAWKTRTFPLYGALPEFTDDTVCTVALAAAIMQKTDFTQTLRDFCLRHPNAGYGFSFHRWVKGEIVGPYGSWGNGAPMRVSAVGWLAQTENDCLALAEETCLISHDHPEAIRGAQAVALAIFLARHGDSAEKIKMTLEERFSYDLSATPDEIRPSYRFTEASAETVPPALICALGAQSWEDAVRDAISLGGDADTLACIAGSIAHALFGISQEQWRPAFNCLTPDLCLVVQQFLERVPQAAAH